jgi:hypothetical protein
MLINDNLRGVKSKIILLSSISIFLSFISAVKNIINAFNYSFLFLYAVHFNILGIQLSKKKFLRFFVAY